MKADVYAHWRDSARVPRLLIVDARVALILVLVMFHPRWWTFGMLIGAILVFSILEYFKFTLPVALRYARGIFSGRHKVR